MKKINKKNIVEKVISYIAQAQQEILMTMKSEDNNVALPQKYFNILDQKILSGITVKRLYFGEKREFEKFKKNIPDKNHYECKLAGDNNYKRMIVIDRKYLFFKRGEDFFSSNDKNKIEKYIKYFQKGWDKI